jgi:uncharacterized protein (TIGR03437 family)
MNKSMSIGSFAWRGGNRLALIVAATALPAAAQVATVTTVSSTLNPSPAAQILRLTAQLQYSPAGGVSPTGTITFKYADTGNLMGTGKVQVFGSTTALTTQASIEVPSLSAGTYTIQASYSGDNVYAPSTSQTYTQMLGPSSSAAGPTINAVFTVGSYLPGIQPGAWVSIFGWGLANVANPGVNALATEIANGVLPTVLDGISVTINGKSAFVAFISQQQVNVQAPDDTAQGPVNVVVTNHGAASAPFTAQLQPVAPSLFQLGATAYGLATRYPDNAVIGNPAVVPGTVAAKPGDILTLWCTGLGPTQPAAAAGTVVTTSAMTASPATVTVGNMAVTVLGAATTAHAVGLYQINIQLPQSIGPGDQPVVATVNGFQSPTAVNLFIATQ